MDSALVDTSFLISLVDPRRPHHQTARRYYQECIRRRVPMLLSTVVISEFHVKEPITDLELRNFLVLPFNIDDAMTCGDLAREFPRDAADDRTRVKDDLKIIAQACVNDATCVFTEDENTLAKYLRRLRDKDPSAPRVVLLKDQFVEAWFNDGQMSIDGE